MVGKFCMGLLVSRCQLFQSSTLVWDQPYIHCSCFQRLAEAAIPCPPHTASSSASPFPSFTFILVKMILRKCSPRVWWEAEIQNGKFQPKWLKSGKVTMDKQEGRATVRTARCHLHSQAPTEPKTCPAPKSWGSRGKIKQARHVRRSFLWIIVLPWIPLSVTIWRYIYFFLLLSGRINMKWKTDSCVGQTTWNFCIFNGKVISIFK